MGACHSAPNTCDEAHDTATAMSTEVSPCPFATLNNILGPEYFQAWQCPSLNACWRPQVPPAEVSSRNPNEDRGLRSKRTSDELGPLPGDVPGSARFHDSASSHPGFLGRKQRLQEGPSQRRRVPNTMRAH